MKAFGQFACFFITLFVVCITANAEPKHIWLTFSGAPETSIDINVLTPQKVEAVDVHYDTESRGGDAAAYKNHVKAVYTKSPMELSDRRTLYVSQIKDLKPGTVYYFVTGEAKYGMSKERKFRTLPGGDAPFRFVDGGDMGVDGAVIPLLTLAGKENPDFGVIGGDIAYTNGLLAGNVTESQWLTNWDQLMVTTDGRMVPIVTAIGNHEVNGYGGEDDQIRSPWYTGLFGRQGPDIFYSRNVGNLAVFFLLDSGHLNEHGGAQTEWLRSEMAKQKDVKYKFAAYHVPLYPAHRPYDGAGSKIGRDNWAPVFDEFGLTVSFEHHDHVFKRSKPIKGDKVVKKGTIYVGDGCFGRNARTVDPQPRWYNKVEKAAAHFWLVDVTKKGVNLKAIDTDGKVIDKFSVK
jgi:hypothetical protein